MATTMVNDTLQQQHPQQQHFNNNNYEQLSPLITQLFLSCINNDITTMQELINNQHVNPYSYYYINLDEQYNIPLASYFSQQYTITLLDASILSNSPSMIDYVINLLHHNHNNNNNNNTTTTIEMTDNDNNNQQQYHHSLSLSKKIGFQPFALGLITNNLQSVQHLYQHYQIQPINYKLQFDNCIATILYQKNIAPFQYIIQHCEEFQILTTKNECEELFHQIVNADCVDFIAIISTIMNMKGSSTALYNAMINQQWKMVQVLLEHHVTLPGQYIKKNHIWTIFCEALTDFNVEESFIDYFMSNDHLQSLLKYDYESYTLTVEAVKAGNVRIFKYLIGTYNTNINNRQDADSLNLFHYAMFSKQKCTIELLDAIRLLGIDINAFDNGRNDFKFKATPLTYAIYFQLNIEIIQKLIEFGANILYNHSTPYIDDDKCKTIQLDSNSHLIQALRWCGNNNNFTIFNYLLNSCPNVHTTGGNIKAILADAVYRKEFELVKNIVEHHHEKIEVDPSQVNLFQFVWFDYHSGMYFDSYRSGEYHKHMEICTYLLTNSTPASCFDFNLGHPLHKFVNYSRSNLEILQVMVEKYGVNPHVLDDVKNVLHFLCKMTSSFDVLDPNDIISKLDYFISFGVNVNTNSCTNHNQTQLYSSPLHYAASNREFSSILVPHLVQKHNADITLTDSFGRVPLYDVVNPTIIRYLANNETINVKDRYDTTPLLHCLYEYYGSPKDEEYYQHVATLLQFGADVNVKNHYARMPIHIVSSSNHHRKHTFDMKKFIIQQPNIGLDVKDGHYNILQKMIMKRDYGSPAQESIEIIKLLLQHGAYPITYQESNTICPYTTILHFFIKEFRFNTTNEDLIVEHIDTMIDGVVDQILYDKFQFVPK